MAATIKDVAHRAGVAVSTASLALNGQRAVKAQTRERVLQAARELHYRPNTLARSLVTQKTQTIGLLVPDIADPYYHEVFRGVDEWAREHQYSVILAHTQRDPAEEARYLQVLISRKVDGIIFAGAGIAGDRHLRHLAEEEVPVVLVGRHDLPLPSIVPDNEAGAFQVVSHLLELGHRRIPMLAGPENLTTVEDRVRGYRRALESFGVSYQAEWVLHTDFTPEGGLAGMRHLLQEGAVPSAVFAGNDQIAFGAVQAVYSAGLQIPQDISIVGFGDIPLSRYLYPPLTTVHIPLRQVGRLAAGRLIKKTAGERPGAVTEGHPRHSNVETVPVEVLVRQSTAPPGPVLYGNMLA